MLLLLIDENFNHRILRGLRLRVPALDVVIVQETAMQGLQNTLLLREAAVLQRVLVTHDLKTTPRYAYARVAAGEQCLVSLLSPMIYPSVRRLNSYTLWSSVARTMNWQIRCCIFRCERCALLAALVRGNLATVLAVVAQELKTSAHMAFVTRLRLMAGIP